MKRSGIFPGLMLITLGIFLLVNNMGLVTFNMAYLWPLFLLVPGLFFEFSFFATWKDPGVLVPGGILTLYGLFFYLNILSGWRFMDSLWPFFILGPAFGLFQLYLFGNREKGVLIASTILTIIALTMFSFTLFGFAAEYFAPAGLILLGLFMVTKGRRGQGVSNHTHEPEDDLESYYGEDPNHKK